MINTSNTLVLHMENEDENTIIFNHIFKDLKEFA